MRARRARLLTAGLAAATLAGCGGSPGDLMALATSGGPAAVNQTIVVRLDGDASCNRGPLRPIANSQLLAADAIVRDAKPYTTRVQTFPPGRPGGRAFVLRDQDGTVRWNETSTGLPAVLPRAELFALRLAPLLCRWAAGRANPPRRPWTDRLTPRRPFEALSSVERAVIRSRRSAPELSA